MTYEGFVPVPTPETAPFWQAARAGQLLLQRCAACRDWRFPPTPACPSCRSLDRSWEPASGTGTVFSYVVNHRAAPGYARDVPYCTAVVLLDEGVRIMGTLVGISARDDLSLLDLPVRVEFEPINEVIALTRFRPRVDGDA